VYTGSVLQAEDGYHIFYTGHNPHQGANGKYIQCVMHAVSSDLNHWVKLPEDTFYAPEGYERSDFRDPYVYYSAKDGRYHMLLCARPAEGDAVRKGVTLRLCSENLKEWRIDRVIYAPKKFHSHECPDLFEINGWWYLIFSEYSEKNTTCYRMSRSPEGPWSKPHCDTLEGRAYYAAKTASDGENRYLFGWVPTRQENKDNKPWMWGGNLLVHQLVQNPDGTLGVRIPEPLDRQLTPARPLTPSNRTVEAPHSTEAVTLLTQAPAVYKLSADCQVIGEQCDTFGILVGRDEEADASYGFTVDLSEGTAYVNTFPCFPQYSFDTFQLRRPVERGSSFTLELLADHDIYSLYINHNTALSVRLCSPQGTGVALYASHAAVEFSNIRLSAVTW
jgi:beta-fructofuranosidase